MNKLISSIFLILVLLSCSSSDDDSAFTDAAGNPISGSTDFRSMVSLESETACSAGVFNTQTQPLTWNESLQGPWSQFSQYPATWNVPPQVTVLASGSRNRFAIRSFFDQAGNIIRRENIRVQDITEVQGLSYMGRTQEGDLVLFRRIPGQSFTETVVSLCDRTLNEGSTSSLDSESFSITSGRVAATVLEINQFPNNCSTGIINSAEVIVNLGTTSLPIYPSAINLSQLGGQTRLCQGFFGQN